MKDYLTMKEVMARYGICRKTVMRMTRDMEFPRPLMFAGRYMWHESVLDDFDKKRLAESKKHVRA